jgi:hypothetical protein
MTQPPSDRVHRFIAWALGGFTVACVLLFLLGRMLVPEVEPGFAVADAKPIGAGVFQVTIDAQNNKAWIPFSFAEGKPFVGEPDVLVQRHVFQAPEGALDLGPVTLAEAKLPANADWTSDRAKDGVTQNPALDRWYTYSYWTHLLRPKGHTYAVRRAGGAGVAFFRVVSYYCVPDGSACLTLEYRLEG